ncbi:MAG: hypothetical protein HRU26_05555 [Psychroserpens sp.]|nr:hypothetical protein [Psychroserpens sp.]
MKLTKNITISPEIWGGGSLKAFKEYFKGNVSVVRLEQVYKTLPKPKKTKEKPSE